MTRQTRENLQCYHERLQQLDQTQELLSTKDIVHLHYILNDIAEGIARDGFQSIQREFLWNEAGTGIITLLRKLQNHIPEESWALEVREQVGHAIDQLVIYFLCRRSLQEKEDLRKEAFRQRSRQSGESGPAAVNQELPFTFWTVTSAITDAQGNLLSEGNGERLYVYDPETKMHNRRAIHAERLAIANLIVNMFENRVDNGSQILNTILPSPHQNQATWVFDGNGYRVATNGERLAVAPDAVFYAAWNALPDDLRAGFQNYTLYTDLEPCLVSDQNPSCSRLAAIIGFNRVVLGTADFSPENDGTGVAHLQRMGRDVEGIGDISAELERFARKRADGTAPLLDRYYRPGGIKERLDAAFRWLPPVRRLFEEQPGEVNPYVFKRRGAIEAGIADLNPGNPLLEMFLIEACDRAAFDASYETYDADSPPSRRIENAFAILATMIHADQEHQESLASQIQQELSGELLEQGPIRVWFEQAIRHIQDEGHRENLLMILYKFRLGGSGVAMIADLSEEATIDPRDQMALNKNELLRLAGDTIQKAKAELARQQEFAMNYERHVAQASERLKAEIEQAWPEMPHPPCLVITRGSGMEHLTGVLDERVRISASELHWALQPIVPGHDDTISVGMLNGAVVMIVPRIHGQENADKISPHLYPRMIPDICANICMPTEGPRALYIATHAAGGVDHTLGLNPGDIVIPDTHEALTYPQQLRPENGRVLDFGPKVRGRRGDDIFVGLDAERGAYPRDVIYALAIRAAESAPDTTVISSAKVQELFPVMDAVHLGRMYQTVGDVRALRAIGATTIGQSPHLEIEAWIARGGDAASITVVTNVTDADGTNRVHHREVQEAARAAGQNVASILEGIAADAEQRYRRQVAQIEREHKRK